MKRALITVYNPSSEVSGNTFSVARQVDEVYICDNSQKPHREMFANTEGIGNIRYIWFGENLGLSCAFNIVLKNPEILWTDDAYVFFFDQDSSIEEGHIDRMIGEYERLKQADYDVGCLGPVYFNTSSGMIEIPKIKTRLNDKSFGVSSIITSSMLCTYGELKKIGFWNEEIFLDMADWDLCWRLCSGRKLCCMTEAAVLRHTLGCGEKKVGPFRLRVGSPFREYYQIRDCLRLLLKPYTPMKYRVRFLAMLFIRSPLHLIFQDNRMERLKYMAMGIRDFCMKKYGALPQK